MKKRLKKLARGAKITGVAIIAALVYMPLAVPKTISLFWKIPAPKPFWGPVRFYNPGTYMYYGFMLAGTWVVVTYSATSEFLKNWFNTKQNNGSNASKRG